MKITRKEYKRRKALERMQIFDRFMITVMIVLAIVAVGWIAYYVILQWIWSN